jgi:DNA-binding beta-propeller fold protein YncE
VWRAVWLLVVVGCANRVEPGAVTISDASSATRLRIRDDGSLPLSATDGRLSAPAGIGVGVDGALYIADSGNHRVRLGNRDGSFRSEIGAFGWRVGEFDTPTDVAVASDQRTVYVSESGNRRIQRWNLVNDAKSVLFDASADPAFEPVSVAVGRNGDLFVVDVGGRRLWRLSDRGSVEWVRGGYGDAGEPLREPRGVCVDRNGDTLVADAGDARVTRFDFAGNRIASWRRPGLLDEPVAVAVDRAGRIYVCDRRRHGAVVLDERGAVVTTFGETHFQDPADIAVAVDGAVYVADRKANRIWRFRADDVGSR